MSNQTFAPLSCVAGPTWQFAAKPGVAASAVAAPTAVLSMLLRSNAMVVSPGCRASLLAEMPPTGSLPALSKLAVGTHWRLGDLLYVTLKKCGILVSTCELTGPMSQPTLVGARR